MSPDLPAVPVLRLPPRRDGRGPGRIPGGGGGPGSAAARLLLAVAVAVAVVAPRADGADSTPVASLDAVAFLVGHWCSPPNEAGRRIEEHYLPPRDGRMMGVTRMLREGRLGSFEVSRIEVVGPEREGAVVLTPAPSGQRPVPFRLVRWAPGEAVFENPEHDFPVRIVYRSVESGLAVRVEGADGGGFGWRMEPCDGPPFLVVPLAGTEPPSASDPGAPDGAVDPDLVALATWLGEAPVVGLGEEVHGSHTLHRLAHRVFAHLAAHDGFRVMALEIDQAHAAHLDAWVQGERDDLEALLAGRWWVAKVFYDEALVDLLDWMRHHNRGVDDPAERLHVAGYDMKQPELAVEEVLAVLRRLDPEGAERAAALYRTALAPGAFGVFPNVAGYSAAVEVALPGGPWGAGSVEVRLEIVAGEGSYGVAGMMVRTPPTEGSGGAGGRSWTREVPVAELAAGGSRLLAAQVEPPPGARHLQVIVYHRGDGWVEVGVPKAVAGEAPEGGPVTRSADPAGAEGDADPHPWADTGPWPLMAPRLQVMDYRAEAIRDAEGTPRLRIVSDPRLGEALAAVRSAAALVEAVVAAARPPLSAGEAARARQAARLVTQAVEWRTLAEPNRDVFLAENLLWLAEVAFPGRRVLATGHASHTGRVPHRMGAFLAEALGDDYRTVALVPGSGTYRYFGPVAEAGPDPPLERFGIDPDKARSPARALRDLAPAPFLLSPREAAATAAGRAWLEAAGWNPPLPDVAIYLEDVEPLRLPGEGAPAVTADPAGPVEGPPGVQE